MGLLDKLLGRTWRTYRDRGDKLVEKEEPGLALHEYREALKRFDGEPSERTAIETALVNIRRDLRGRQLARAQQLHGVGQYERSRGAAESALHHATTPEEEQEVHDFMASLSESAAEAERRQEEERNTIGAADADIALGNVDERFFVLLASLDNDQMAHYEKLDASFREGLLSLNEGEFKEAMTHFKKAREVHPDDAFVLCEQGRALFGSGAYGDAVEVLRKADAAKSDSVYIKLQLTEALWEVKDMASAERALQQAHDIDPSDEKVLIKIAEHALRTRDFQSGIDAVGVLLDRSANDLSLLRLLGQLHQGAGNLDEALSAFETVLKLKWKINQDTGQLEFDASSAFGAAMIYIEQNRKLNRAIDLLHAMLSVTQGADTVNVYLAIAKAHELRSKPRLVRETLQKALEAIPAQATAARAEVIKRIEAAGV